MDKIITTTIVIAVVVITLTNPYLLRLRKGTRKTKVDHIKKCFDLSIPKK